ncbi:VPLPA-CTERM-specific exosortase XrtD [Sulfurirhabdus autotrophica]|uniref:Exosortase D (VPLPA-CTERM-specific) n=1 Tax=Sulfurirhabdus autotrophica TaxID=1706046 RepID=A0A4R3XRD7_9PROT|nr:VPLPA-CTERM-specific exosortase XrtD [Sulfurirhabdus autotrophica]TCV79110.1 exosortase D (VPLPA-CTERM-specific) [Sulfurirhabdus autotrophica]
MFLEGNVIDLGTFKLQVVEACSGLRYLFPLLTLGFIAAYFFKGSFWKRAVIFLSSIPLTVFMNSFRIGVIGVTVDNWGPAMAEGFLHDFEGWVVFMACTFVLVAEMWVLAKIGKDKMPLREAFGLEFPAPSPKDAIAQYRKFTKPFIASALVVLVVASLSTMLPERVEVPPHRIDFSEFPLSVGDWQGKGDRLDQIYIDALKFDDYIIADFVDKNQQAVNFYVAYYASQRKGESAHSPRTCIPGGGWKITSLTQRDINGVKVAGHPLVVNRLVIEMGETKQLVYYWFQQRGRVITNEYLVKWYLFWDALTRNRTDGSLVRLTALIQPGEDIALADAQLTAFAKAVNPELKKYIPE